MRADDPAVWIHPRDPGLSLVLGTDKQGGLHSSNMDGSRYQNFKLYAWEDIAGTSLLIDTTCRVRRPGSEAPV